MITTLKLLTFYLLLTLFLLLVFHHLNSIDCEVLSFNWHKKADLNCHKLSPKIRNLPHVNATTTFLTLILPKIVFESRIISQNKKTQKQNSDVEINFILVEHFFGLVFLVGKVLLVDMLDVPVAPHPRLLDV